MCQHSGEIRHGQTEGRRTRGEVNHGGNISYTVHASCTIHANPSLLFMSLNLKIVKKKNLS